jgi:hypothetical protein
VFGNKLIRRISGPKGKKKKEKRSMEKYTPAEDFHDFCTMKINIRVQEI